MSCSLVVYFFPPNILSDLETGNSRRGQNLTNMLDREVIRSGIR